MTDGICDRYSGKCWRETEQNENLNKPLFKKCLPVCSCCDLDSYFIQENFIFPWRFRFNVWKLFELRKKKNMRPSAGRKSIKQQEEWKMAWTKYLDVDASERKSHRFCRSRHCCHLSHDAGHMMLTMSRITSERNAEKLVQKHVSPWCSLNSFNLHFFKLNKPELSKQADGPEEGGAGGGETPPPLLPHSVQRLQEGGGGERKTAEIDRRGVNPPSGGETKEPHEDVSDVTSQSVYGK